MNANPFSGRRTACRCSSTRTSASPTSTSIARGFTGAMVLMVLVLALFVIARFIGRDRSKRSLRAASLARGAPPRLQETPHDRASPPRRHRPRPSPAVEPRRDAARTRSPLTGGPPAGRGHPRGPRRVRLVRRPPRARRRRPHHAGRRGHRADRPVGLRQVDVPADAQPHARAHPRRRPRRQDPARRRRTSTPPGMRAQQIRLRVGMVFQKPNPFPAMSIRENVLAGLKLARIGCDDKDGARRGVARAGQPLEGGARPARPAGRRAVRRPAAAALHRPQPGRAAQRAADGRAVLGARPDLDPAGRGDDRTSCATTSPS